jgi:integrase
MLIFGREFSDTVPPKLLINSHERKGTSLCPNSLTATLIRTRHYSYRTEPSYIHWIKRYILFHNKRHPAEMGAAEVTQFKPTLKRAGLPSTTRIYDLRHSCASLLIKNGESPKVVADRLGHSDPAFTLKTYVDTDSSQQRTASEKLARILAG